MGELQTGPVLRDLAEIHFSVGCHEKVIECSAESYPISVRTGYQLNAVETLYDWASSLAMLGRHEEGRKKFEEAVVAAEKVSSPSLVLYCRLGRASCFFLDGQIEEASKGVASAIATRGSDCSNEELRAVLHVASALGLYNGDLDTSVCLCAAAQNHYARRGSVRNRLSETLTPNLDVCRERLGEAFDRAWARGLSMSQSELRQLALETAEIAFRRPKAVNA